MKSIFTKLGTLLFCGAVALVGCSDFSADLKYVDEKIDKLTEDTAKKVNDLKGEIKTLSETLASTYARLCLKKLLQKLVNKLSE